MKRLATKLVLPTALLAGVMALSLADATWNTVLRTRDLERRIDQVSRTSALLLEVNQRQADAVRALLSYRFRTDPALLQAMAEARRDAERALEEIHAVELPARGAQLRAQVERSQRLQAHQASLLAEEIGRGEPGAIDGAFERWRLAHVQADAMLADFTVYGFTLLHHSVDELEALRSRSTAELLLALGGSAAVVLAIALFLRRSVVKPLSALTEAAAQVPSRPLALPDGVAGRDDEIGVLARTLDAMTRELLATNERLSAAVRARDEFLTIASHELKTPLTSMKLQLGLLSRAMQQPGAPPPLQKIGLLERQFSRLAVLVRQLLDVSRIAAGHLELQRADTDLSALVLSTIERFEPDLVRGGHAVEVKVAPGVHGRWDPDRLDQVVTNLISNAVRHAPGAPIAVSLAVDGGCAVLEVRDHGPGLPPELDGRIFERFQRGAKRDGSSGLGLGLFIARSIIEEHGGTIRGGAAPSPGGARFVVTLPISQP